MTPEKELKKDGRFAFKISKLKYLADKSTSYDELGLSHDDVSQLNQLGLITLSTDNVARISSLGLKLLELLRQ